jgi:hypothetical protein
MAWMIPEEPAHKSSEAELRLFHSMKSLPEDFVVLHSLGLTHHEHKRWSEIDFVVVCPDGVFLLEVKGGVVERTKGEWFVTDRNGKKDSLGRGPFAQVGGAEAATRRFLWDRLPETRSITMGYAVVTPDCELNLTGLDVDRAICFDATNISLGPKSLLGSLALHWRSRIPAQSDGLKPEILQKVVSVLCADIPGIPSIRQRVSGVLTAIHAATLEQEHLLADLHFQQRVIVKGPAGSGKSTIALNECKLRAAAGQKVLYLCHTRSFAEYLNELVAANQNLMIMSADQFIEFATLAEPVDVLVVDEGQDTLLGLSGEDLGRVLRGGIENGVWRLLLDPYQLLDIDDDRVNRRLFEDSATVFRSLDLNVRGTIEVAVTSSALGYVNRIRGGIQGPDVDLQFAEPPVIWQQVMEIVNDWGSKGIIPADILVLFSEELNNRGEVENDLELQHLQNSLKERGISFSTPMQMKGRESTAVVFVGADNLETVRARQEAYLACTRAQVLLAVVGRESLRDQIPDAYAAAIAREAIRNLS